VGRKKTKAKAEAPERGPLLLVLETATGVSSVALYERDQLLGHAEFHTQRLHAKLITVMVQQLLDNLSLQAPELAGVVVSAGPGSYTGLRVGVSTAKGLCMAIDKPLLSLGSLETLACSVRDVARVLGARIVPMIDARRMEVYCRPFDAEARPLAETKAQVVEENTFDALLAEGPVLFVGDGAEKCRALLEPRGGIVLSDRLSSAAGVGERVWEKFQAGEFEDLVTFEPYYLKNFVATVSKKKIL